MAERLYRRMLHAVAGEGEVVSALEDDFHRFEVRLTHRDGVVTAVDGKSIRTPWSTCPMATANLALFVGLPMAPDATPARSEQGNVHCTHLYDLARFAITQGLRGGERRYEIALPDDQGPPRDATIARDGRTILRWTLAGRDIVAPPEMAGKAMGGRMLWPADIAGDPDLLEAAAMLRRVLATFRGRGGDYSDDTLASDVPNMAGMCFAYLPGIAEQGIRTLDERDFTARPMEMLGELE